MFAKMLAKIVHDRTGFERGAPRFKFFHVFGDDGFGTRDFGFAGAFILLDDFAEIVDVVEIQIVEVRCIGIDVARHAEVHDENRPAVARGQCASSISRVSTAPLLTEVTIMSGVPRTFSSDAQATASPPIRAASSAAWLWERFDDSQVADAAIAQMLDYLLSHRAGADDQRGMTLQISEDSLGELHARQSYRHWTRAHFGFRTHALAYFERALKYAVEHWSGGTIFERLSVGGAELA